MAVDPVENEGSQRLDVFPDRQGGCHPRIVGPINRAVGVQLRGFHFVIIKPPDKPRKPVGNAIYSVNVIDKIGDQRVVPIGP